MPPAHALIDARTTPPYDLGPGHPFARDRQTPLFDLLERHAWLAADELIPASLATDDELKLGHDAHYIEFSKQLSASPDDPALRRQAPVHGLGTADNPIAPDQHLGGAAAVGNTLACVRRVLDPDDTCVRAFNTTGGLHHAMPAAASGFCIYNDLVIGIRLAQQHPQIQRIAYVDFDVHHGDGVEFAFRDDPDVLTVSFHESPDTLWPFTGQVTDCGHGDAAGSIANLPFASGTTDASWQQSTGEALRTKLAAFQPDLLVTQHGADPHWEDPLAALDLTTDSFRFAAALSRELADTYCAGRWVASGGGGYQPVRVLPRAWAITWAVLSGRDIPERVDSEWLARWQGDDGRPLEPRFLDPTFETSTFEDAARQAARSGTTSTPPSETNRRTLDRFLELHGR